MNHNEQYTCEIFFFIKKKKRSTSSSSFFIARFSLRVAGAVAQD